METVGAWIEDFLRRHHGNYLHQRPAVIRRQGLSNLEKRRVVAIQDGQVFIRSPQLLAYYGNMIIQPENAIPD